MILRAPSAVALVAAGTLLGLVHGLVMAQPPAPPAPPSGQRRAADPHPAHGTPVGWKFSLPKGDPARGREVFVKLECYTCHEVTGEKFPAPTEQARAGPELSQMAPLHDAEYFAEAVINPIATIEKGKGYETVDGSSKMPEFNDHMTAKELIDLVAYLRSLTPAALKSGGHHGH